MLELHSQLAIQCIVLNLLMLEMSCIQLCLIDFAIYIDLIIVKCCQHANSIQLLSSGTASSRHGALFTRVGFGDAFSLVWKELCSDLLLKIMCCL
jgi:hypothetical protein